MGGGITPKLGCMSSTPTPLLLPSPCLTFRPGCCGAVLEPIPCSTLTGNLAMGLMLGGGASKTHPSQLTALAQV